MDYMRIKEAANFLGVSTVTLRKYCNEGEVPHGLSVTGQRIFKRHELEAYRAKRLGLEERPPVAVHYARSSSSDDVSLESQLGKLSQAYGIPDFVYKDKGSGLNDKRKGLSALIKKVEDNHANGLETVIYVTQKDRLTRFGVEYLVELFRVQSASFVSLNDEETKEPETVLMQDFMSLIASFSGKFYRLRGWKEQQRLVERAKTIVDEKTECSGPSLSQ